MVRGRGVCQSTDLIREYHSGTWSGSAAYAATSGSGLSMVMLLTASTGMLSLSSRGGRTGSATAVHVVVKEHVPGRAGTRMTGPSGRRLVDGGQAVWFLSRMSLFDERTGSPRRGLPCSIMDVALASALWVATVRTAGVG